MKKVICCIPLTWAYVPTAFFESMFGMQFYSIGKYELGMITFGCAYLDRTREELVDMALRENPDYIFFLDADQTYPADTPEILMEHIEDGKLVIGGITPDRKEGDPLVYSVVHDIGIIIKDSKAKPFTGMHKVEAMGFGGIMISPKVFEIMEPPRFQGGWNWATNLYVGEDVKFYQNCKKHGIDVWCDTDLPYGHIRVAPVEFKKGDYTNNIDGWMEEGELKWLYSMAKDMDSIVEIGSWKGRSTHALLNGCKGAVWAVDHFKGSPGEHLTDDAQTKDVSKIFMKNVGHFKNLELLKMDSIEASKKFKDRSIDMVFIDGAHSHEAVKADIEAWLPKTKKMICGHDLNFPGVEKAVKEKFGDTHTIGQSIWIKEVFNG